MDDDDDFGDLYADVLRPQSPPPSPPKPRAHSPAPDRSGDDWILGPAPIPEDPPLNWNDDDQGSPAPQPPHEPEPDRIRVLEEKNLDGEQGLGEFDIEMEIPGLGGGPASADPVGGLFPRAEGSEEWDSDSDDDLRIVLNDDTVGGRIEEDEDGEEDDLVIVADDVQRHQYQVMEEEEWGEEALQVGLDGEKKEGSEAVKGGLGAVSGQRVGYGHGFHSQYHSQFKYVRPGAVDIPGGTAAVHGAPGAVRPPLTMGFAAGRGRGTQKGFHPGYGVSPWANNNLARPFGIGLDFTLPSHKTIFDVNIDVFDEKPWRLPGVDVTDFFNFGLDEVSWKGYCKQLEQFRIESTMQSKIRVYESGRSDHDFDPDMPPELAAASGLPDLPAENTHPGKMDSNQLDPFTHVIGPAQRHPQLPTGRAIQVESGYGERLPSMDTRPPRIRDFEAIIEIVCQDFVDELDKPNTGSSQPDAEPTGDGPKGGSRNDGREATYSEISTEDLDHNNVPEGHDITISSIEASNQDHYRSKTESPAHVITNSEDCQDERKKTETLDTSPNSDLGATNNLEFSPSNGIVDSKELGSDPGDEEENDRLRLPDSPDAEEDELPSDLHISADSYNDDSMPFSAKNQKLNSQVEHPAIQYNGDDEDLGATLSNHGKEKSGSSIDYMKGGEHEDGEDEVMQAAGSLYSDEFERDHSDGGCSSQQKDDYVQESWHEINGSHVPSKGREDSRQSRPHKSLDSNLVDYENSEAFERLKERDSSTGAWNRRDGDAHDLSRRDRDDKRWHGEEMRLKDRNRPLINDRKVRADDLHLRKGTDDNEWRTPYGREGSSRQRERTSIMKQHEYLEDTHANRRKDEDHRKREIVLKEHLHGYQAREDAIHRRGRMDGSENRVKEDVTRVRDRIGNPHVSKYKDESSKIREREDRQRLKVEGYMHAHREREEVRSGSKGGRGLEDKSYGTNLKVRNERKGPDDDPMLKDRRHEQSRRGERAKGEGHSQHRSREELHIGLPQVNREDKSSRHGRLSSHSTHTSGAFSNRHVYRDIERESSRKNKNIVHDQNGLVSRKRKHEDFIQQREKGRRTSPYDSSTKPTAHPEDNDSDVHSKKDQHYTGEKAEGSGDPETGSKEDAVSDDENRQESRRGRSKLERWTSHKEREYSLRTDNINGSDLDTVLDELTMTSEVNKDAETVDRDITAIDNSVKEERDRHLEAVEKLKKRSERFNLPMPIEKDIANKRMESEISSQQGESFIESEVKQERPTRKRRWVSG